MPQPVKTKHWSFDQIESMRDSGDIAKSKYAYQYMVMFERSRAKEKPVIVELGTRTGISTTVFLQVCRERGGRLYSIDIDDCSSVSSDPDWTFIQSDSTHVQTITERYPELKNGIDIMLVDSLHKRQHVEKEIFGWMPYLKKDALIFFDDVDPAPYRKGSRKDNVNLEFDWESIQELLFEIFYQNEGSMNLEIIYGSTGLAIVTKLSDMGASFARGKKIYRRTRSPLRIARSISSCAKRVLMKK